MQIPPRPALALLLAALAPALLAACQPSTAASEDSAAVGGARRREVPRVRVAPVERREMVQELETTSTLESEREIQVFPRTAGFVVELLAEEGDEVEEGQVLARLDDRDLALAVSDAAVALQEAQNSAQRAELAVLEAEQRVGSTRLAAEQAERDHQRNQELYQGGETVSLLSLQALEASRLTRDNAAFEHEQAKITQTRAQLEEQAAETAVARAEVAVQRAQLALAHTRVTAPFAGAIAQRMIRVGDMVSASQATFVLTDVRSLRAIFHRPQEELALFAPRAEDAAADGTRLSFRARAEAWPEREFVGQIQRISPTIDAQSGQFRVTARIDASTAGVPLLPGMLVRMRIVTDRHPDALVVPKRALRREGERRYVLVVPAATEEPGSPRSPGTADATHRVSWVDVREGFTEDDSLEVVPLREGELGPGTLVVVVGSRDLAEGDAVTIDAGAEGAEGAEDDAGTLDPGQAAEADEAAEADDDRAEGAAAGAAHEGDGAGEADPGASAADAPEDGVAAAGPAGPAGPAGSE